MDVTLTIIGSIVGSIILSVIGNLLTSPVKDWLDQKSLVSKTKRKKSLERDLRIYTELHQDPQKLVLLLIVYSLQASLMFMLGICGGLVGTAYLVMRVPWATVRGLGRYIDFDTAFPNFASDIGLWAGVVCAFGGAIFIIIALNIYMKAIYVYKSAINYDEIKNEIQQRLQVLAKSQKKKTS